MNPSDGRLVKSRVVTDPAAVLVEALDTGLTGYASIEPQETLLLEAEGRGVLTFRDGVPEGASYSGTGRTGPAALADLATPGPYRVELYVLDDDSPLPSDGHPESHVPPGMPAERLAGDGALAASTRRAAPGALEATSGSHDADRDRSAVEAFLDDETKIQAIRDRARAEAAARAEEWGFD